MQLFKNNSWRNCFISNDGFDINTGVIPNKRVREILLRSSTKLVLPFPLRPCPALAIVRFIFHISYSTVALPIFAPRKSFFCQMKMFCNSVKRKFIALSQIRAAGWNYIFALVNRCLSINLTMEYFAVKKKKNCCLSKCFTTQLNLKKNGETFLALKITIFSICHDLFKMEEKFVLV